MSDQSQQMYTDTKLRTSEKIDILVGKLYLHVLQLAFTFIYTNFASCKLWCHTTVVCILGWEKSVKVEFGPNLRILLIEEVVCKRWPAAYSILVNSNYLPWKWVADTFAIYFAKQTLVSKRLSWTTRWSRIIYLDFWTQSGCFWPILVSGWDLWRSGY